MTDDTPSGARSGANPADLVAEQVESIVAAAQEAAEGIRKQAKLEVQEREKLANQEGETIRAEARRDATRELDSARRKAARMGEDARQEAQTLLEESRAEANELREHTRREVAGRVEAAEHASEEVLAEARALSGGLRRLGKSLGEQAERILRDVEAAHKRMRADLRAPVPERDDFELPGRASRGRGRERDSDEGRTFELPEIGDAPSARRSAASSRGATQPSRPSPVPAPREPAYEEEAPRRAGSEAQPFDAAAILEDDGDDPGGGDDGGDAVDEDLDVPSWLRDDRPA